MKRAFLLVLVLALSLVLAGCRTSDSSSSPQATASMPVSAASSPPPPNVSRRDVNRLAVRLNLPLFWASDANQNGAPDPDEVKALLFYDIGRGRKWTENGKFTPAFDAAFASIRAAAQAPAAPAGATPAEIERRRLVGLELDQGAPTLLASDFRKSPDTERHLVQHVISIAGLVDGLYATMRGMTPLTPKVPADDPASQRLFWRNWSPRCEAPKTVKEPACSAIPGAPPLVNDAYPSALQSDPKFCEALEKQPNAKELLDHFDVVRDQGGKLVGVPYNQAYPGAMQAIAAELRAAAADETDAAEGPLKAYLEAAAQSFTTNDWGPADEAWSRMNATNSKYYLRVGPDEVLGDPCSHKAQFHTTFARINMASLGWQTKLTPVQDAMESALATLIGPPYAARKVRFHLPDFIDIVLNAGDDRSPLGATAGESLPNWGKVAAEGRGRTVAMSNLDSDPDSRAVSRERASSILDGPTMDRRSEEGDGKLLGTILHEATHNLGPTDEYRYKGKTPEAAFGGKLASMLEELKAESGALYYLEFLRSRGIVSDDLAKQSYVEWLLWALRHISEGLHTGNSDEPYCQLSAIQVGFLLDEGAVTFDAAAPAKNGSDKGAFGIVFDKMPAAVEKLMKSVATLKALDDRAAGEGLVAKYVDHPRIPLDLITERENRFPTPSYVYSVDL